MGATNGKRNSYHIDSPSIQIHALETCFVYSHWLSGTRGHCVDRIWVKTSQNYACWWVSNSVDK